MKIRPLWLKEALSCESQRAGSGLACNSHPLGVSGLAAWVNTKNGLPLQLKE